MADRPGKKNRFSHYNGLDEDNLNAELDNLNAELERLERLELLSKFPNAPTYIQIPKKVDESINLAIENLFFLI